MNQQRELIFSVTKQSGQARLGVIKINSTTVSTPVFMPVGTQGTVKAVRSEQLLELGFNMILGNAYHLSLRPGDALIAELGGLHKFINWPGLILTDSGGFQAFSLSKMNTLATEGYHFKSHLDGAKQLLTPEKVIAIQKNLGSDIAMCLDVCLSPTADYGDLQQAVQLTTQWANRSLVANQGYLNLFAIIQGGSYKQLRQQSAQELCSLPFAGFAIGGVSLGEEKSLIADTLAYSAGLLPSDKPRYAMGIGDPYSILAAVEAGVDMFDCVLPTRIARNGLVLTTKGPLSIKKAAWAKSTMPIDTTCQCYVCKNYSLAYLRHLYRSGEILSSMLNTWHNLYFFNNLFKNIQLAIKAGQFAKFKRNFLDDYQQKSLT